MGDRTVDDEGRFMALVYPEWVVVNTYVPTLQLDMTGGERKKKFFQEFQRKMGQLREEHTTKRFLWIGDINTCRLEKDHSDFNEQFPGCSEWERDLLESTLGKLDMRDTMREEMEGGQIYTYYQVYKEPGE